MIGKITGRLGYIATDHVLVEAGGVGYVIYCSDRTRAAMPSEGEVVALFTELVVREDLMQLFGFLTLAEKEWHRLLTSVQGIGAKVALAILGTLGPDGVGRAIALGDVAAMRSAPGVGPKTAQRVVLELKDKAAAVMALGSQGSRPAIQPGVSVPAADAAADVVDIPAQSGADARPTGPDAGAQADALSALVNLGYGHGDAAEAVAHAADAGHDTTQDLIREALRRLAPKG